MINQLEILLHKKEKREQTLYSKEYRKINGIVYTPPNLASYVAHKLLSYYFEDANRKISFNKLKLIDPACGDGMLLFSVWRELLTIQPNKISKNLIFNILCGVDKDRDAVNIIRDAFDELKCSSGGTISYNLASTNSLSPFNSINCFEGWNKLKNQFSVSNGFDLLIANPPWGADLRDIRKKLSLSEFSLLKGQVESSDLFIELAMKIVKPNGMFAFIIPDSIFSPERRHLRELLLKNTEIKFIGRFGEKIFENVNRACAVIICKNVKSQESHNTDCLRLSPELRRSVIQGAIDFKTVERKLGHKVRQNNFLENKDYIFDIDALESERTTLFRINTSKVTMSSFLDSTRGVELSKTGKVVQCNSCKIWRPKPNLDKFKCTECKKEINLSARNTTRIIQKNRARSYKPLIVGESLKRYSVEKNLWIDCSKPGISYKSKEIYKGPKILVRKTGVGITATIDYTDSYTNQVVYIFKKRSNANVDLPIEFFLAIMNSRAIYYYLVKTHGETEWKSHPYLSQRQILNLPFPKVNFKLSKNYQKAIEIANLVKKFAKHNNEIPSKTDALIEKQIATLFRLTKKNYKLIYDAIDSSEDLLPVRCLKNISIEDIFS